MIIDGQTLAADIKDNLARQVSQLGFKPGLAVILVGHNSVSSRYVDKKIKLGRAIGVEVKLFNYPAEVTETVLLDAIAHLNDDRSVQGIIVQLPLPARLDSKKIITTVSPAKDVDALTASPLVLSPVVAAVQAIFETYQIDLTDKNILVVGAGRLVGRPVAAWLAGQGFKIDMIDATKTDLATRTRRADILILGAGRPGLIRPEMVKSQAVIIDAGTSESADRLVGDADPACAEVAAWFTPVPGGVGPLTVAMLFNNLLVLAKAGHYR